MSEKTRDSKAGGPDSRRDTTNGAAATAPASKHAAATMAMGGKAEKKPDKTLSAAAPTVGGSKRQKKAESKTTLKATAAGQTNGKGRSSGKGASKSGKGKSTIGLQFSSPSADPPARRGLKPDPEKVRRARQESQLKKPESAPASRRAAATAAAEPAAPTDKEKSDDAAPADGEQTAGIPAAARLSGAIKPTRPTNQRLFRRHRRGLSIAASLLIVSGVVWWSGAFQKRTDLANSTDPAEVSEPAALETAAARPNDEEVRRETEKLLADLGLFTGPADGNSDQDLRAAIRDYQAMAGLPVNGEASYDLLLDLRAVASAIVTE